MLPPRPAYLSSISEDNCGHLVKTFPIAQVGEIKSPKSICHVNPKFYAANIYNKVASVPMTESQSYVYFEESVQFPTQTRVPSTTKKRAVQTQVHFSKR